MVIAAEGYPGSYPKGMEIKGIDAVDALPDTKVFQAGTKREGSRTLSSGGRVLAVEHHRVDGAAADWAQALGRSLASGQVMNTTTAAAGKEARVSFSCVI